MDSIYKINQDLDIPIYRQLVDTIRIAIKKESLVSGQRLPTVNELTRKLGIARGTVKRAYDELEHAGLIEKVQGRGTFVSYHPDNSASRKEKAMTAIGNTLDYLEEMGLTANEISIFINLKLRERSEKEAQIKVAIVECNPENLSQMSDQLRHIQGIDLYSYLLDNIKQYPYKLNEEFDLIITTASHAEYLETVVPEKKQVVRVALRPSAQCLSKIIKMDDKKSVGIVTASNRFGELLYNTCLTYAENVTVSEAMVITSQTDIEHYLKDKQVVLVPKFYEKHSNSQIAEAIEKFGGEVISCNYEMDEGSFLYLETKIKRLLGSKTI